MLFPIKKILVCTDLTPESDTVLTSAESLRKLTQSEVDLLHVCEKADEGLTERMREQIVRSGLIARCELKEGEVFQEITALIQEKKYDLLVIGHETRLGFLKAMRDSIAKDFISSVPVPTLVLVKPLSFKKLAGLVDEKGQMNWMIRSAFDFYRSLGFKELEFISLWHKAPDLFKENASMLQYEDDLRIDVEYFEREGEKSQVRVEAAQELKVANQLKKILREEEVDLAVVKRNRGKGLNKLIIGSETQRLLDSGEVNLLVMPV